jgi:hypothetical protein
MIRQGQPFAGLLLRGVRTPALVRLKPPSARVVPEAEQVGEKTASSGVVPIENPYKPLFDSL